MEVAFPRITLLAGCPILSEEQFPSAYGGGSEWDPLRKLGSEKVSGPFTCVEKSGHLSGK